MKPGAQITLGFVAAVALLVAAIWLWLHNLIIFAAPVGALALGCAWVGIDNAVVYPAQRARRPALPAPDTDGSTPPPATPDPVEPSGATVRD